VDGDKFTRCCPIKYLIQLFGSKDFIRIAPSFIIPFQHIASCDGNAVFNYVKEHPGCRSTEIISHTSYPKTTMERCLSYLKRQGLVEYSGSKKRGGYHLTNEKQSRFVQTPEIET